MKNIIVAGGCFWGVQEYYSRLKGIINTKVGYTDCDKENPTYEEVCNSSGHVEAVYLEYNDSITLEKILEHLFRIIDPTSLNKQAEDTGIQYRTGVYYNDDIEREVIEQYIKSRQIDYDKPVVVEVKKASKFFNAEDYHQNYLKVNTEGYCHVNFGLIKEEELK